MIDIQSLTNEINNKSSSYQIAELQDLRKTLKGFSRRPGNSIFSSKSTFETFAFHHGGRTELQFNIGFDGINGGSFRHGIAFSFETNQTLPNIDVLRPKVRLFNEFLRLYPEKYSHMRMWHWDLNGRSDEYSPSSIPSERIDSGIFVFLGILNSFDQVDSDQILRNFDELLPLYKYVEGNGSSSPLEVINHSNFQFKHGCTIKKIKTSAQMNNDPVDVSLRHNTLQYELYKKLVDEFGPLNVGTELKQD